MVLLTIPGLDIKTAPLDPLDCTHSRFGDKIFRIRLRRVSLKIEGLIRLITLQGEVGLNKRTILHWSHESARAARPACGNGLFLSRGDDKPDMHVLEEAPSPPHSRGRYTYHTIPYHMYLESTAVRPIDRPDRPPTLITNKTTVTYRI